MKDSATRVIEGRIYKAIEADGFGSARASFLQCPPGAFGVHKKHLSSMKHNDTDKAQCICGVSAVSLATFDGKGAVV